MDPRHPRITGRPWPTGGIAHPEVLERMRREGYPWNKPGGMNYPTSQIPDLPPIPSQAPRPEGLQRVLTGVADAFTNNYFDFDQRGGSGSNRWTGGGDPRIPSLGMNQGRHPGHYYHNDPSIKLETIPKMRQWNAPNDLTVTQGAEQGVRRGGGILDRIKGFLGGLEVMPNELVDDPRNPGGPQIHPDLLDNQWRDRYEKGIQQWNR